MSLTVFELGRGSMPYHYVPDSRALSEFLSHEISMNMGPEAGLMFHQVFENTKNTRGLYAAGALTLFHLSQLALLPKDLIRNSSDSSYKQLYNRYFKENSDVSSATVDLTASKGNRAGGEAVLLRMLNLLRRHVHTVPPGRFAHQHSGETVSAVARWYEDQGTAYISAEDATHIKKIRTVDDILLLTDAMVDSMYQDCVRTVPIVCNSEDTHAHIEQTYATYDPYKGMSAARLLEILASRAIPIPFDAVSIQKFCDDCLEGIYGPINFYPRPF